MTEADSVLSTPRIDSSLNSNVVKFPCSVSRLVHSRKPRRSKKAAGAALNEPPRRTGQVRLLTGEKWEEITACFTPEQQQAFMADVWKLTRAAAGIHG
jgi:hypothetical protein